VATVQDRDIVDALKFYTLDHPMGPLLDGQADRLYGTANFQVFEIGDLMEMGERAIIPTLLYLFRLFEKGLRGQPALLILDEAWVMLGHPTFREKLREWLKTLRKANCAVIIATQSLSDAQRSGMVDVLRESCPRVILLPNPEAGKDGIVEFYRQLGLNETEIQIIREAERKREYYVTGPEGRRLIDLALDPIALAFVAVSDKPRIEAVKAMAASDRDGWPLKWLRQEGVRYDEYLD
jgi:type IV secretion system protein VirB4